uniref:Hexosyltransferase n=2 Tax=Denticeps clupeoides TaxID=299321 RepID=A0AAY4AI93_9TELE
FVSLSLSLLLLYGNFKKSPLWFHGPGLFNNETHASPIVKLGPVDRYTVAYPHTYSFVQNEPRRCGEEKPFVVLMVPVAPQDQEHRSAVRRTWGSEKVVTDKVVSLFFFLGLPSVDGSEKIQEGLLQESKEYRDILQSDFLDAYVNLTIKSMVMLEWLNRHCVNASYAMKIDSDMFLNVPNLIQLLLHAPMENYMTGLVAKDAQVIRDPSAKWYLPPEVFPEPVYPPYALGLGYIISLDLPGKLIEGAKHVKALYIEDVYMGLCMRHLGIPFTDTSDPSQFSAFPIPYERCRYSRLIATTTASISDQVGFWKDLKEQGFCE